MKQGLSLSACAQEVARQASAKRDFKCPSGRLAIERLPEPMTSPEGFRMDYGLVMDKVGSFPMRRLMHQQVAERVKIPWPYYERLMSEPAAPAACLPGRPLPAWSVLGENVNYWLHKQDEMRLVRTLDGQARAYLGDRYRPLDNFDLFKAVAPILMGEHARGMRVESIMVTETRFYIKAFSERITGQVKVGDIVQAGVSIQNSEVGHSTIEVAPAFFKLSCLNGAIVEDQSLKRRHVGRGSNGDDEGVSELYSDRTRMADDDAFWRKVVDVARAAFDEARFEKLLEKMRAANDHQIPRGGATLQEITEVMVSRYGMSGTEGEILLLNLIEGRDMSQYGLMNAITRTAQEEEISYDRATDLEKLGGQFLELSPSEWSELVAA